MNSLPTIEQANKTRFLSLLEETDPQLYMIKIALDESNVNPIALIPIIRVIGNLGLGTGFGEVTIQIIDSMIVHIKGSESTKHEFQIRKSEINQY